MRQVIGAMPPQLPNHTMVYQHEWNPLWCTFMKCHHPITHGVSGLFVGNADDDWDDKSHFLCDWPTARGLRRTLEKMKHD